jgi:hypothetical protein
VFSLHREPVEKTNEMTADVVQMTQYNGRRQGDGKGNLKAPFAFPGQA